MLGTTAIFHFSRGVAAVSRGRVTEAEEQLAAFRATEKRVPADAVFGLNPAGNVLKVAEKILSARIALAKNDNEEAIKLLQEAVALEDQFAYDEPPIWFLPVRESLGGVLLRNGKPAEAEQVFRADLERNKRNGRSLFGLMEALKAQKKTAAVGAVQKEFEAAWKNADTKLTVAEL